MQRRRVHASEIGALPLNNQVSLIATVDESNGINAHGLRACFTAINTGATSAQSTGTWALFCIPDEISAVPGVDISELESEDSNAFIWAVGLWSSSTETPEKVEINIKTSRNCQRGARIVLRVRNNVQFSTNPSVQLMISYFTKSL